MPTETVYGLAASLGQVSAIEKIYSLKGRPSNNPLIIHVNEIAEIEKFALATPPDLPILAKAFWPGPLTIILPVHPALVPSIARASLPTAAFRIPKHPLVRAVISATGPLVMPSANKSGRPSATSAEHVEADFGLEFPVLDGGFCESGLESTILLIKEDRWHIVRLGYLTQELIGSVLGYPPPISCSTANQAPLCPGQLFRHYAPKAALQLIRNPLEIRTKAAIVGFSDCIYPRNCKIYSLGSKKDPQEAAERLYSVLRQLDEQEESFAYVDIDVPDKGLWVAIKERLRRAAEVEE